MVWKLREKLCWWGVMIAMLTCNDRYPSSPPFARRFFSQLLPSPPKSSLHPPPQPIWYFSPSPKSSPKPHLHMASPVISPLYSSFPKHFLPWFFLNNTPPPSPHPPLLASFASVFSIISLQFDTRRWFQGVFWWVIQTEWIEELRFQHWYSLSLGSLSSGTFLYIIPSLFFLFYALTGAQSLSLAPDAWK